MRQDSSIKQYKTKKIPTISLVVLLGIFLVLVWAVVSNSSSQKKIVDKTDVLDEEIEELKQKNLELTDLIDYFASSEYVEKEAREKLNLVKPGEKVVVVTHSDQEILNAQREKEKMLNSKKSPVKWWDYFFGE